MKWQWVAVEQVDHQEVVHQEERTERAKQHIQVAEAVTQDPTHIQVRAEVAEEPRQYS